MRATEGEISRGLRPALMTGVGLGLAALLLLGAMIAPAMAAKKKSKKPKTVTSTGPISPGGLTTTSASCPKGYHVTGGGQAVTPSFNPASLSGVRTLPLEAAPTPIAQWSGGAAAFTLPPVGGTLNVFGRCEANEAIKGLSSSSNTASIPLGIANTSTVTCPSGTKVLTGGFLVSGPPSSADPTKRGASVLQSRRLSTNQWIFTVANPSPPEGVGAVSATFRVLCTKGGKSISEATTTTPILNDLRTNSDATCSGKKVEVVGAGFQITPNTAGSGGLPAVGIDEFQPTGKQGWHLGLYELPLFNLPIGSSVTNYAYCKKIK